jgi:hypothetical protein
MTEMTEMSNGQSNGAPPLAGKQRQPSVATDSPDERAGQPNGQSNGANGRAEQRRKPPYLVP